MLRARRDGVPINRNGRYTGDKVLLMVGVDSQPGNSVARSVKRQVQRLGFNVRLRLVRTDRMYLKWCGVRSAKVAICPNVGWFFDYFDPQSLLVPTFNGDAIFDGGNNWSLLDKAGINRAMKHARRCRPGLLAGKHGLTSTTRSRSRCRACRGRGTSTTSSSQATSAG